LTLATSEHALNGKFAFIFVGQAHRLPICETASGALALQQICTLSFCCFRAAATENARMSDHIYKKIELVGSSPNGFEEAIKNALVRAEKTIRNMRWFEVTETRGHIDNGKIDHWQVTLKVGFTLEK
jgi:flavin-binding protein dodecin